METDMKTNKQVAQDLYRYFGEGNIPAILELLTDDIKWTCPGPNDILPYARVYNGKKEVTEFFKLINDNKEFPKFEPREFIADGNKVVALGYWDAKSRKTGKPYSGEWAMAFYFIDGKVKEHREYYDTYGEAMASKGSTAGGSASMELDTIAESFFYAVENKDFTKVERLLADNFKITGVSPEPLGAKEMLGVLRAYTTGMPDFKFNYKIGSVSQSIVETKVKITGTHTKEMPGPIPGVHNIPATNKKINMPEEKVKFTIRENKIESLKIETSPDGGIPGLLKRLGVEIPTEVHH
jgi:uncharacterized protein